MKKYVRLLKNSLMAPSVMLLSAGSIICFVLSYVLDKNNCSFFSNVFTSIGGGFATGIIIYFLSNLRNNKLTKEQNEFQALNEVCRKLRDIEFEIKFFMKNKEETVYIDDLIQFCRERMSDFMELSEDILAFPESLFCELNINVDDSEYDIEYFSLERDLEFIISKEEYQQKDEDDLLHILQILLSRTNSLTTKMKTPRNRRRERLMSFEKTVL